MQGPIRPGFPVDVFQAIRTCSSFAEYSKDAVIQITALSFAEMVRAFEQDDIWLVSFMDYDLGYFDLETRVLEPLDNPFGPRLSPM